MPGYEARIVDEEDRPVPVGEMGNLLIRGDSTCAFYWNQHEKTKRTIQGEWIRTGDKYTQDADGYYWYAGRVDDMLKPGGIFVSPVEIESALDRSRRGARVRGGRARRCRRVDQAVRVRGVAAGRGRFSRTRRGPAAVRARPPARLQAAARRSSSSRNCRRPPRENCSDTSYARPHACAGVQPHSYRRAARCLVSCASCAAGR